MCIRDRHSDGLAAGHLGVSDGQSASASGPRSPGRSLDLPRRHDRQRLCWKTQIASNHLSKHLNRPDSYTELRQSWDLNNFHQNGTAALWLCSMSLWCSVHTMLVASFSLQRFIQVSVIICPIAIAYSMGQIIKPICVRMSVCPSASTLTVAFLGRFSPKLAQT